MEAKHVNLSYVISDFDELNDFLDFSDDDKVQYIIEHTDYVKNYIIESVFTDIDANISEQEILDMSTYELFSDERTSHKATSAEDFLRDGIRLNNREDMEVYITPYLDINDIPSFMIYESTSSGVSSDEWIMYINDDSMEVYIEQHFSQGIHDLGKPNNIRRNNKGDGGGTFNVGYLVEKTLDASIPQIINQQSLSKLEMLKKTMGFLLFKGDGVNLRNNIAEKDVVMFSNESANSFVYIYKLGDVWHVYGNNKSNSAYKAPNLSNIISWVGKNHNKHKKIVSYNPIYIDNLKKLKRSLYNQRLKYLSSVKNRKKVQSSRGGENKKPVVQMDRNSGYSIQTWPSASDASKTLGISRTSITKVANGIGASAGGFGWRFA